MGLFNFNKDSGRAVSEAGKSDEIRKIVTQALGNQLTNLSVDWDPNGTVRLMGTAKWYAAKQKAVLLAGNVKGVEKVDDQIVVDKSHVAKAAPSAGAAEEEDDNEAAFYTIEKGDTLSAIAQRHYKDANAWRRILDANKGVIDDPDKIYPGQQIRIPK